jgi:hypothetical protein
MGVGGTGITGQWGDGTLPTKATPANPVGRNLHESYDRNANMPEPAILCFAFAHGAEVVLPAQRTDRIAGFVHRIQDTVRGMAVQTNL